MNEKKLNFSYLNQCEDVEKNKPDCFIAENNFSSLTDQPCNGIPVVIFEDLTNNHNKILINAQTVTPAPCRATIIIETRNQIIQRDLDSPIPPNFFSVTPLNIQVEDLRRISIVCQGNPGGICRVFYSIQKTFSICCTNGQEEEENCGCLNKDKNIGSSFISQHNFNSLVQQPCDGSTSLIFEDGTSNHNKTFINVQYGTSAPCQATLVIETDHETIIRELPNFPGFKTFGIQMKDVRRFYVRCQGNPGGFCDLNIFGTKTFCIHTESEKDKKVAFLQNPIKTSLTPKIINQKHQNKNCESSD
jgi:hypothetical protein